MKMDVNDKERRRRKLRYRKDRSAYRRAIWRVLQLLLIAGPKLARLIELVVGSGE